MPTDPISALHPEQRQFLEHFAERNDARSLLVAAPGLGKSTVALFAARTASSSEHRAHRQRVGPVGRALPAAQIGNQCRLRIGRQAGRRGNGIRSVD